MDGLLDDVRLFVPPLLIVVGLLGIVVPVLPGLLLVLGGVLLWAALTGTPLAWGLFAACVLVAAAGWALQYLVPGRRMKERGVPTSTLFLAVVAAVVGFFAIPVVGALLFFVGAIFLVESARTRDRGVAWTRTKHAIVAVAQSVGIELLAALVIAGIYVGGVVAH
ncbi:DUF456 domain-containing protein [Oryzobacter sp. R7]|uniref:DUF456 domain-containing protein n=1 Tax=Oryzobacter faecalis TaxID=3388656 RepID=UPI00398CFB88